MGPLPSHRRFRSSASPPFRPPSQFVHGTPVVVQAEGASNAEDLKAFAFKLQSADDVGSSALMKRLQVRVEWMLETSRIQTGALQHTMVVKFGRSAFGHVAEPGPLRTTLKGEHRAAPAEVTPTAQSEWRFFCFRLQFEEAADTDDDGVMTQKEIDAHVARSRL